MKTAPSFRKSLICTTLGFVGLCNTLKADLPSYYEMTILNSFAAGEYYGATIQSSDIWILSNFQFDIQTSPNVFTNQNPTAGTYGTAVQLSNILDGKVRIHSADNGTRMYAVLNPTLTPPTSATVDSMPNNYWEWSFSGNNPGTLDLSWIDSWDFSSQMIVQATGTTYPAPTTVTYGVRGGVSTATIADRLKDYTDPRYAWLQPGGSGFSTNLTYTGATDPVKWITNTSATQGQVNAASITSFTEALTAIQNQSSNSTAWAPGTPTTGPNWTSAGFRLASLQPLAPPDGSSLTGNQTARGWSAYVNFSQSGGNYTLSLTDFTIYGVDTGNPAVDASYTVLWNAVTDAAGAVYTLGGSDMLDAIWTSSPNALNSVPQWLADLGANNPNLFYALYNAVATGAIYEDDFVNNTPIPSWTGYVPYLAGQDTYNFEILSQGGQVAASPEFPNGRAGALSGSDLVALMEQQRLDGTLVNPYLLELLSAMQQTPSYLYPSQDFWSSMSVGSDTFIGMQTGPLNSSNVFGDATLTWHIGTGAVPEPSSLVLFGIGAGALLLRRRLKNRG